LTGGADQFVYNRPGEGGDTIADFSHALGDTIVISHAGFGAGLPASGALDPSRFVVGPAATASVGQFLWSTTTDTLSWDADGTGSGGAVQIAILTGFSAPAAGDIHLS